MLAATSSTVRPATDMMVRIVGMISAPSSRSTFNGGLQQVLNGFEGVCRTGVL
jgi:hypothetical protein